VISIIDSDAGWRDSRARVEARCAATGAPAFVVPDWIDAALQWRPSESALRFAVAVGTNGGEGFAPLVQVSQPLAGLPARTLQFVTVPDTQFVDIACGADGAQSFSAALATLLIERKGQWDCLRLNYLSDAYPNWRQLEAALATQGIACAIRPAGSNPFVDLSGGFDAYYGARSRSLKKAVNLSANRLAKLGAVSVEWVRGGDRTGEALAQAIRVSAISWKHETGNSLDRPGPRAFIERLTESAAGSGRLSLWLLRLDGKVIATEYQLMADGNVHALRSDFDPAFAEASPGTYLNHHLLKQLFGQGLQRYYMGPGSNAYKLRWTDVGEPLYSLTAYSPTARGRLLQWLEQSARPLARRWRERLQRTPGKAEETQA
jgi:CelD/BcsL family acetyltransferase involved in cellulose biosynthesis